jgi:hypothetical protein
MNDRAPPTSGAAARYRIVPIADQHLAQSARAILAAAAQTGTQRAVVLGAGACEEIPLAELAERYEQVVLVDLDQASLDQALAAPGLPEPIRHRFDLRIADLTGLADELARRWRSALEGPIEVESAIERLAAIADSALAENGSAEFEAGERAAPDGRRLLEALGGAPFDLVVASCLLSQLHAPVSQRAEQAFGERFAAGPSPLRAAPCWQTSLDRLARRIEADFMSQLPALVAPGGRIYLSESVQVCFIEPASDGAWMTAGTYRMTKSLELRDYVDARFQIEAGARWTWVAALPEARRPGRLFDVQALTLVCPQRSDRNSG